MKIGFYIADLLRNQDEVGLPGLGTFTKVRVPASYDTESNSFIPPGYHITFNNATVSYNSLTEYISIHKNLSQSSAEYFVNKFTSSLVDLLRTSGFAEIKPLGIIRQQDETITFEAGDNAGIAGRFYGLKPVIERKERFFSHEAEILNEEIVTEQKEEILEDELDVQENKGNVLKMVIIGSILFFFTAAGLLYAFNPTVKNLVSGLFSPATSTESLPTQDTLNSNMPVVIPDSTIAENETALGDSSLADSSALSQKSIDATPDSLIETQPTYEIIGAGFTKKSEAENYIKQLAAKGIPARIAEKIPGRLIKVSLGSFEDEQSAQKELRKLQKQVTKDAWIYRPKLKKTQ
jgi:hypothetical protein